VLPGTEPRGVDWRREELRWKEGGRRTPSRKKVPIKI